jgi:anthranilate synthase
MKLTYSDTILPYDPRALDALAKTLDARKGMYLASDTEEPGRYARWDIGFSDPPVEALGFSGRAEFRALNEKGEAVLDAIAALFTAHAGEDFTFRRAAPGLLVCDIAAPARLFSEEERSRRPSPLSPLRALIRHMEGADAFAGFYGAFKYDLLFCFDPVPLKHPRGDEPLFRLYLPDALLLLDRRKETLARREYTFAPAAREGAGTMVSGHPKQIAASAPAAEMTDSEYAALVTTACEHIRKGDVFEVVLSRVFSAPCKTAPSALFSRLRRINPSPYAFLLQLGDEQLVGASPEMFVRVEGRRVESCPIAGTARRSRAEGEAGVIEDAGILRGLLNSAKDEAELNMCTDVDRNDKARVCEPGSVRLLARRHVEAYAGLFHTVDHVEGILREGFDGIDAFLSHMWAVTLTGAPKREAAKIIENLEPAPRGYYGAAVGALHFCGDVNTGITIRTTHLKGGTAFYRVGASLVYDSVPEEEAAETHTKSASFRRLMAEEAPAPAQVHVKTRAGEGKTVVLIDNEDSFVQTLADYIRRTGANAVTYRHDAGLDEILKRKPGLVLHSPGPGMPAQFGVPDAVRKCAEAGVPQFGVCLGLQGIFEAFGGTLGYLQHPRHGKTWNITHKGHALFEGVPNPCRVGAYHSIHGLAATLPDALEITAANENGHIMALAHKKLPVWAVQFHPESILSTEHGAGFRMIENVMRSLAR